MIFYTGEGYLVFVFFVAPVIVVGGLLYYGFGIDVLRAESWWPPEYWGPITLTLYFAFVAYRSFR